MTNCREALVVDAIRTPIGRYGGALATIRPDDLSATIVRALVDRNRVDPERIDDVFWGAANQSGEDNRNVARMAVLIAGLPTSIPGVTVNRLCGSGLQAINSAAHAIKAGEGEIFIAGGVESMSRAPFVLPKCAKPFGRGAELYDTTLGWRMINERLAEAHPPVSLGETAEIVAERFAVSRDDQDVFAFRSQQRTRTAADRGIFGDEIIALPELDHDEHPRPSATMADLSKLIPAFRTNGTVTAGNSSGINDGAAGLLLCTPEIAERNNWKPLGRVVATAVAGVDPSMMGVGPIPATHAALDRARLVVDDIELFEINEAFAAQSIACLRELKIDPETANVNGGAIAIGHPLGCSGARIAGTLLREMGRRGARYGLATMCIGVGQGITTIFERV